MGKLWRSEDMVMLELIMQREAAHDTVDELGKVGVVQFIDLNEDVTAFQKTFASYVKRCDDLERSLYYFSEKVKESGIEVPESKVSSQSLDELETVFEDLEKELRQLSSNYELMVTDRNTLLEMKHVLNQDAKFFNFDLGSYITSSDNTSSEDAYLRYDPSQAQSKDSNLGFLIGVIPTAKLDTFQRVLFRATRGNVFIKDVQIAEKLYDPTTNEPVLKSVFIVFYAGDRVRTKITRYSETFGAKLYPYPEQARDLNNAKEHLRARLSDLEMVIKRTEEQRHTLLDRIAHDLDSWKTKVNREKHVYHMLNKFDFTTSPQTVTANCWSPKDDLQTVIQSLREGERRSHAQVPSICNEIPSGRLVSPTYFRVNKFTQAFQGIVDAYGIARYKEINPNVLNVITFPFLFAVMFADAGHGLLMTLFAAFMILREKQLGAGKLNELFIMLFKARYVLLLMGIFSMYVGVIYNEWFSLAFDIFGSQYAYPSPATPNLTDAYAEPKPHHGTYVFGIDPVWFETTNKLSFYNSLKMKLSIILGVSQMTVGLFLNLGNFLYFKKRLEMICQFIPEIVFLMSTFGYMSLLIVMKWFINYRPAMSDSCATGYCPHTNTCNLYSPSLLESMTKFFLSVGKVPTHLGCTLYNTSLDPHTKGCMCAGDPQTVIKDFIYTGQEGVQKILLFAAAICIPWLLLPKPIILRLRHGSKKAYVAEGSRAEQNGLLNGSSDTEDSSAHEEGHGRKGAAGKEVAHASAVAVAGEAKAKGGHGGGHDDEEFDFGEIVVHQLIHTIEYILGGISNTASYLRLWALSLAHSELSEVFWQRGFLFLLKKGILGVYIGFAVWAGLTVGVLMIMESLSAFLHALRLHWVEFQNKFYMGDGFKFCPFSYSTMDAEED